MARRVAYTGKCVYTSPMLLKTWKRRHFIACWTRGSHRSDYEDYYLNSGRSSRTFRNNLLPPGSNWKRSKYQVRNKRSAWRPLLVFFCFAYFSTLIMKAILSSETSKNYCTTRLYTLKQCTLHFIVCLSLLLLSNVDSWFQKRVYISSTVYETMRESQSVGHKWK
jgi:hypothetical protein